MFKINGIALQQASKKVPMFSSLDSTEPDYFSRRTSESGAGALTFDKALLTEEDKETIINGSIPIIEFSNSNIILKLYNVEILNDVNAENIDATEQFTFIYEKSFISNFKF